MIRKTIIFAAVLAVLASFPAARATGTVQTRMTEHPGEYIHRSVTSVEPWFFQDVMWEITIQGIRGPTRILLLDRTNYDLWSAYYEFTPITVRYGFHDGFGYLNYHFAPTTYYVIIESNATIQDTVYLQFSVISWVVLAGIGAGAFLVIAVMIHVKKRKRLETKK